MAGTNHFSHQLLQQTLGSATVKCMLLDDSAAYTHDPDLHEFVDDLDGTSDGDDPTNEPSDGSYARVTVSGTSIDQDDTNDEGSYDISDVTFPSLSTTNDIQAVVFYAQDGFAGGTDDTTPNDDPIIAVFDDDSGDSGGIADLPIATNGSDLTIQINASGLFTISTPL